PVPCRTSPFPSQGPRGTGSPASTVLWRCATPCVSFAVLRFLRVAIPCVASVVSLLSAQDARPQARGASSGPRSRKSSHGNVQGIPRFLGNPLCLCPVLRPRQDRRI